MIKVYEADKVEQDLLLRLKPSPYGGVSLVAVDEYGYRISGGNILRIDGNGIFIFSGVTKTIQLPRGKGGGIKLTGKEE